MPYIFQILLYNSSKHLPRLLSSFEQLELDPEDQIELRFRDQSEDTSEKSLSAQFFKSYEKSKQISINYAKGENLGFGAGHNQIWKDSQCKDDFFILNPDGFLMFDFLTTFKAYYNDFRQTDWAILEASQFPLEHPKVFSSDTYETPWSSGACCFINNSFFAEVDGFDENIFMYCEDVDLSFQARLRGHKIYHMPQTKFVHLTQDLDKDKDRSFEILHSLAGNLYLRSKYGNDSLVTEYDSLLHDFDNYKEIATLSRQMISNSENSNVLKAAKVNEFFVGTEYAQHRW